MLQKAEDRINANKIYMLGAMFTIGNHITKFPFYFMGETIFSGSAILFVADGTGKIKTGIGMDKKFDSAAKFFF